MKPQPKTQSDWSKPELKRIGRIADVAGAERPVSQAAGNVKS